jgi:hypothetical protein
VLLVGTVALSSIFIVYKDSDPSFGNPIHPRKVPEFIGSIPPDYTILISNRVKEFPFVLYMASYDRLRSEGSRKTLSFVDFEEIRPLAAKIAETPLLAVVTDRGPDQERLMREIKRMNPAVEVIESQEFLACLTGGG